MKKAVKKAARTAHKDVEVFERLARLETMMESQVETTASLSKGLDDIKASLQKYQGFWGAVTLIGAACWAAFALFKDNLFQLFHGQK
jgi:hypothetical protein